MILDKLIFWCYSSAYIKSFDGDKMADMKAKESAWSVKKRAGYLFITTLERL